jgi:predicted ATP-binding protein involved in virulence
MRIDQIEIQNFKTFERQSINLHSQFNLVVGVNGTGKTSLLEALSVAAGSWFLGLRGYDSRHISHDEVRLAAHDFEGEIRFEPQYPAKVKATGVVRGQALEWERSFESPAGKTLFRNASDIKALGAVADQSVRDAHEIDLPLISYYGTGRLWQEPRSESQVKGNSRLLKQAQTSRLDGYLNSVTPRIATRELVLWIARQSWAAYQQGKESAAFHAVKQAMVNCIEGADNLYFDPTRGEVVLVMRKKWGTQPFSNLSDGQRVMLAMVGDIAQKAAKLNPHLGHEVLSRTEGLVLIDELDLHLHPRWQRRVIGDLRKTFPKIQFVCTTHSPQLIGQVQADELILLDGKQVASVGQTYGMDSNWILRHVMGADDRDPDVSRALDKIFELVDNNEFQRAQIAVDKLIKKIGEHPELVEAQTLIDRYSTATRAGN